MTETPVVQEVPPDPDHAPNQTSDDERRLWTPLRDQQDRQRYLRPLIGRGGDAVPTPDSTAGVTRSAHPVLGSPASITRTGSNLPNQQDVRDYLRHSADLTMRAGNAAGLVYPPAVCALAEHYVFRRIAGSSSAAMAAAATAAAELGRGAPDRRPVAPGVSPGFGGLAELVGWLAGDPSASTPASTLAGTSAGASASTSASTSADTGPGDGDPGPERMARLLQPSASTRSLYRLLITATRTRGTGIPANTVRLLLAAGAVVNRPARALLGLFWAGVAIGWLGLTSALVNGSRAGAITGWVTVGASMLLLVTFAVTGLTVTALAGLMSLTGRLRALPDDRYGLVPGAAPSRPGGAWSRWLDRRAGMIPADGTPPLFGWLSDRLDDLAGLPPAPTDAAGFADSGYSGRGLTFGDLWSGTIEERPAGQLSRLREAAREPEQRVINLVLLTSDLSGRRPYRLPFPLADDAETVHGGRFLFCEACVSGLVPERIVTQMIKAAPSTDTDHTCPRHATGVLRELPEPWDLPVVFAVRLSFSPPGLFQAVPLYSIGEDASSPVRTHWFGDGALAGHLSTDFFDVLLPRWPTFGISIEDGRGEPSPESVRLPAQDAARPRRRWGPIESVSGLLSALVDTGLGGPDGALSDRPGLRGRMAMVQRAEVERGWLVPPSPGVVLALALRGLRAGTMLRERFTGSDDLIPGQTQTDRYRWIRMRMALREYQAMSLDIAARLPLYRDLASSYHLPEALTEWFTPRLPPAERDPIWADAASAIVTLRAMSAGGVLDFDVSIGAPPTDPN